MYLMFLLNQFIDAVLEFMQVGKQFIAKILKLLAAVPWMIPNARNLNELNALPIFENDNDFEMVCNCTIFLKPASPK